MIGRQVVKSPDIGLVVHLLDAPCVQNAYDTALLFLTMYSFNFCRRSRVTATRDSSSYAAENHSSRIEIHSLINATPQTALVTPYATAYSNLSLASYNPGCYATPYKYYKYDGISLSTPSSPSSVHLDSYDYDADVEYFENCEDDGEKR